MKILITAGQVYGRLDDNKLVGNRARGIWALRFAKHLAEPEKGNEVTLLLPDTMGSSEAVFQRHLGPHWLPVTVAYHNGFESYRDLCYEFAETHDAAVMAAAVTNWIPDAPVPGKMDTKGYKEGAKISVKFRLAERVINRMREINPKLTLVGCKMLSSSVLDNLLEAAWRLTHTSKSHVVVANDLQNLHQKHLVYPDGTVQPFNDEWEAMYDTLAAIIEDEHWKTVCHKRGSDFMATHLAEIWDAVAEKYRGRFTSPYGDDLCFGSFTLNGDRWWTTPRTKNKGFTSKDAVPLWGIRKDRREVEADSHSAKATLNAPLLIRVGLKYNAKVVLHLHEYLDGVPTVPYAPPGTDRDCMRDIPAPAFNIEGHGFVAVLDPETLEIINES